MGYFLNLALAAKIKAAAVHLSLPELGSESLIISTTFTRAQEEATDYLKHIKRRKSSTLTYVKDSAELRNRTFDIARNLNHAADRSFICRGKMKQQQQFP